MSLLGFLTGVGSLFKSGSSGKSSTSQTTNGSTEEAQSGKTSLTASGSATQNTSGTSSTTGNSSTTGTTNGSVSGSSQGSSTGKVSESGVSKNVEQGTQYSSQVLASLDSLLTQSLASGSATKATDAVEGRLTQVQNLANQPAFDVNSYVSGIASSAAAATQSDLDSRINGMLSATGASEGGNSMAALLGNRMRNDAAANLAGIVSNATAQGNQIKQSQQESLTGQISGLSGNLTESILGLIQSTKGAQSTVTGTGTTQNTQNSSQQQSQTQQEQSQQTQNQNTQQSQTTNESAQSTSTETQKQDQESSQIGTSNSTSTVNQNTKSSDGKNLFDRIADALGSSAKAA